MIKDNIPEEFASMFDFAKMLVEKAPEGGALPQRASGRRWRRLVGAIAAAAAIAAAIALALAFRGGKAAPVPGETDLDDAFAVPEELL